LTFIISCINVSSHVHGFDGQLFRGRFKSILVEEDDYLLELVRYIHRNPLRAGMVDNLADYAWSSYRGYLSRAKAWDWLHKDFILGMLATDKRKWRQAYLRFMGQDDTDEFLGIFERKKLPAMLGSETFISWAKEAFFTGEKDRQIPESIQLAPDMEKIKREVCQAYGVEEKDILTAQRGRINEPRNVAIYLCRTLRHDTLMELGREFGMTGYSPAGSAVERVKKRLVKNKKLQKKIEIIKKSLLSLTATRTLRKTSNARERAN